MITNIELIISFTSLAVTTASERTDSCHDVVVAILGELPLVLDVKRFLAFLAVAQLSLWTGLDTDFILLYFCRILK